MSAVIHIITPWPGVTNLTPHDVENALKLLGTEGMHYYNFYCIELQATVTPSLRSSRPETRQ